MRLRALLILSFWLTMSVVGAAGTHLHHVQQPNGHELLDVDDDDDGVTVLSEYGLDHLLAHLEHGAIDLDSVQYALDAAHTQSQPVAALVLCLITILGLRIILTIAPARPLLRPPPVRSIFRLIPPSQAPPRPTV